MSRRLSRQAGFTLVEIIMTIMVAAIIGTMLFQVFGTSFIKSTEPVKQVQNAFDLQQAMEKITADYENSNKSTDALAALKENIQNNVYGQYTVVSNEFIVFDANTAVADTTGANNLLKVTIKMDSGESLTTLFAAQ